MAKSKDATEAIREYASKLPDVVTGTSCNQSSFKIGKGSFLFIGPGAKGVGFKAMFKLESSVTQALDMAEEEPTRFQVGSTAWVTVRFSNDEPLPKSIWQPWLKESYEICRGKASGPKKKTAGKKKVEKKAAEKIAVHNKTPAKVAKKNPVNKRKK